MRNVYKFYNGENGKSMNIRRTRGKLTHKKTAGVSRLFWMLTYSFV
ncbi:hypothetical protein MY9_3973 [Bacillus sp. JS]|nr:hypothetical protein MY9_3973 [Bacillus sp. JS]